MAPVTWLSFSKIILRFRFITLCSIKQKPLLLIALNIRFYHMILYQYLFRMHFIIWLVPPFSHLVLIARHKLLLRSHLQVIIVAQNGVRRPPVLQSRVHIKFYFLHRNIDFVHLDSLIIHNSLRSYQTWNLRLVGKNTLVANKRLPVVQFVIALMHIVIQLFDVIGVH